MRGCCRLVGIEQTFGKRPGEKDAAAAGHVLLPAIQFIGDGRGLHGRAGAGMPKGLAVAGFEGQYVAVAVAGEGQAGVGGQDAGARAASANSWLQRILPVW